MTDDASKRSWLVSSGARVQFAIGVALVSVIPLLTLWYLSVAVEVREDLYSLQTISILVVLGVLAVGGYAILRKYPVNIVRLRGYLERMIRGELPDQVSLLPAEDDITAVETCLNLILKQLRGRLDILQAEKTSLQRQLYQMQKMESLGVMAAGVAHDFNNLLSGIMGHAGLVGESLPADSPAKEYVKEIENIVMRASELTGQMLVYAGRGRFVMERVNLTPLIRDMTPLLRSAIGKHLKLEFNLADGCPEVEADATQMRQVVMNLVINAGDAIGQKPGTIRVSTCRADGAGAEFEASTMHGKPPRAPSCCVEIADDGAGIDEEKRSRIFDPFFSTKPKGRGLGLAIVLGIVTSHGGAIAVDSEVGKGTRFRILLPGV